MISILKINMSFQKIYTKHEILQTYKELESSDISIKTNANNFLNDFKSSSSSYEISIELIQDQEVKNQFLGSILLHQIIKQRVALLINSEEDYKNTYDFIFNQLLMNKLEKGRELNGKGIENKVIERLSYTISVLICIGIYKKLVKISDFINFSNLSYDYFIVSILILENLPVELNDLNGFDYQKENNMKCQFDDFNQDNSVIPSDFFVVINEKLKSNGEEIIFFVKKIFEKGDIERGLNLMKTWSKSHISIINYAYFIDDLFRIINEKNSFLIEDIFSNSIFNHDKSKLHTIQDIENPTEYLKNINEELSSHFSIIINIKSYIIKSLNELKSNKNFPKTKSSLASIFSTIIQCYPFLLFMKNEQSSSMLNSLYDCICFSTKEISSKFSEALNELREFLLREYKLNDFSNEEKQEFGFFLIRIIEGIALQTQLSSLTLTYKKAFLSDNHNQGEIHFIDDLYEFPCEEEEINSEVPYLSSLEYRKVAESMYYNIALIIISLYKEEGNKLIFSWVIEFYKRINQSVLLNSIPNDQYIKLSEVILHFLKSISDIFSDYEVSSTYFNESIQFILNSDSSLLSNDTFAYSFILLIDLSAFCFAKSSQLTTNTCSFLFDLSMKPNFQTVACKIIYEIFSWIKDDESCTNGDFEKLIEGLYIFIDSKYSIFNPDSQNSFNFNLQYKFSNSSIWYLIKAFCIAKQNFNDKSDYLNTKSQNKSTKEDFSKLYNMFQSLIKIPIEDNMRLFNYLSSDKGNSNQLSAQILNSLLIRNFHSMEIIIKEAFFLDHNSFLLLGQTFFNYNSNLNLLIFERFFHDKQLIICLSNLLFKIFSNLKSSYLITLFEIYALVLYRVYLQSPDLNICIKCLSGLWTESFAYLKEIDHDIEEKFILFTKENLLPMTNEILSKSKLYNESSIYRMTILNLSNLWSSLSKKGLLLKINTNETIEYSRNFISSLIFSLNSSEVDFSVKDILICLNCLIVFNIVNDIKEHFFKMIVEGVVLSFNVIDISSINSVSHKCIYYFS